MSTKTVIVGKWEFFKGNRGKWYFHLKAANGKILCQSEGYSTKKGCLKGIAAIKKCVNGPIIELLND